MFARLVIRIFPTLFAFHYTWLIRGLGLRVLVGLHVMVICISRFSFAVVLWGSHVDVGFLRNTGWAQMPLESYGVIAERTRAVM